MKKVFVFICFLILTQSYSQEKIYKYYVHLNNYDDPPTFENINGLLVYDGTNIDLASFLSGYDVISFNQAFPSSLRTLNLEVFILETTSEKLMADLVNSFPYIFKTFTELINDTPELVFFPDDYGNSNPNGNSGANINRNDLDYINIAKAWDITTGVGTTVGISDARIKINDQDFLNKVVFINPPSSQNSPYSSSNQETFHGTQTAGIAAAKGNNAYGSTGVCYDCNIVSTQYGNYNNLLLLAQSGVRVINMSWTSPFGSVEIQNLIDEIVEDYKTVLVASGGNMPSHQTNEDVRCPPLSHWDSTLNRFVPNFTGMQYFYPASYNGVIAVSGIGHKYLANDSVVYNGFSPLGFHVSSHIKDSFSPNVNVSDFNNPIGLRYHGWSDTCYDPANNPHYVSPQGIVWTYTFNEKIDILAPAYTNFNFPKFAEESGTIAYYESGGTSSAAPYVSGTAALMLSVNSCLAPTEIDAILKLTTKDVEAMPINQNFIGNIGAGALNAGDAVEFVDQMKKVNGNAVINNHIFNRFYFVLDKINNKLTLDNVKLKDNCVIDFTAKNQIHLLPGTGLLPNANGSIHLRINPLIDITCSPLNFVKENHFKENNLLVSKIVLSPNPNSGSFRLLNIKKEEFGGKIIELQVFDLNGRNVYKRKLYENDFSDCRIDLNSLSQGVYIIKLSSDVRSVDLKLVKN